MKQGLIDRPVMINTVYSFSCIFDMSLFDIEMVFLVGKKKKYFGMNVQMSFSLCYGYPKNSQPFEH